MIMWISNLMGLSVLSTILAASPVTTAASPARVNVAVSIRIGPPVLPVYAQPICPGRGYIWVPGYWAYGDDGYFWVPGMWVLPPRVGLLWTPGYWAFDDGFYLWHAGYWGATVGFYGGINYGFGYPGTGFYGGYWRGDEYFYNTRVTNVNTTIIRNVYNTPFANEHAVSRVSFNGGPHGIHARPTAAELSAARTSHVAMTRAQLQHQKSASNNRTMLASVNHGRPDVAATARTELSNRRESRNEKPVTKNNSSKGGSTVNERRANTTPTPSHSVAPTHSTTPTHNAAPTHTVSTTEKTRSSGPSSLHSTARAPSHTTTHNSAPPTPAVSHNERPAPSRSTSAPTHSATTEHAQPPHPSSHATVSEHPRPTKTEKSQPHSAPSHSQSSHTQQQSKPEHTQQSHTSAPRPAPAHPAESQKPEHSQH
jgi:WXXGXW repeat (2 copies)